MKRFISVLLIAVMISCSSLAEEIDLSSLSFEELRSLQTRITIELTNRPEWRKVPVPPGLYQIGVDIPAGDWCLKCDAASSEVVYICYGKRLNESHSEVIAPFEWYGEIGKESNGSRITFLNIKMIDGYFIEIKFGSALFTTPEKNDLGF